MDSQPPEEDDSDVLCYCQWLTRTEIVAAIPYAKDLKDLRAQTAVCTVCFGCEAELDEIVEAHGHRFGTQDAG